MEAWRLMLRFETHPATHLYQHLSYAGSRGYFGAPLPCPPSW
jgi:hypothetical protein